jgi:hypothetical protein
MQLRGALAALYRCTAPEVLVEGRAGTSKTTGILVKLIADCERHEGCRVLICRQTRKSLSESVMVTFDRMIRPGHPAYKAVQRINRHANEWPNGSTIVWGGLDNPAGLFSTEWDRVYVAEATEVPLDAWDLFGRAMRNNRTPYHQRIADCNPGPPGHWLNQRATPATDVLRDSWKTKADYDRLQVYNHHQVMQPGHPMRRLISVHQDNPAYWDAVHWRWLPLGEQFVMGTLAGMSGHNRARMFDGRWRAAEGSVYGAEFDETRNVISPFPIPADWPWYLGWDPGYDHPTAILWFAVAPNGTLYVVDEIYEGGKSVEEHCKAVHAHNGGRTVLRSYADPQHAFSRTAQSPETIASQAARHGVRLVPWPRTAGQEEAMVNKVRERMRHGTLKFFRTCTNAIREHQNWMYKRTAQGERPPGEDAFEDKDNHTCDVVKGVVAANPMHVAPKIGLVKPRQ